MSDLEEVALVGQIDAAFEAGQAALVAGDLRVFAAYSEMHQALAELYFHRRDGGLIQ